MAIPAWERENGRAFMIRGGRALELVEEARREVVAELRERVAQLAHVDRARAVSVEVLVDVLPVFDVLPEAGELGVGSGEGL